MNIRYKYNLLEYLLSIPDNVHDIFSLLMRHPSLLKIGHGLHFMPTDSTSFSDRAMARK